MCKFTGIKLASQKSRGSERRPGGTEYERRVHLQLHNVAGAEVVGADDVQERLLVVRVGQLLQLRDEVCRRCQPHQLVDLRPPQVSEFLGWRLPRGTAGAGTVTQSCLRLRSAHVLRLQKSPGIAGRAALCN